MSPSKWTAAKRRAALEAGNALPPKEGESAARYPIADCEDVRNAVEDYHRNDPDEAARRHIAKRAVELDCTDELPDDWRLSRG